MRRRQRGEQDRGDGGIQITLRVEIEMKTMT
jgi:hypothetical protein